MSDSKPPRRKLLDFHSYGRTVGDMGRLQSDLHSSLRPQVFEIETMQELHFQALKLLKPVNGGVINPTSII